MNEIETLEAALAAARSGPLPRIHETSASNERIVVFGTADGGTTHVAARLRRMRRGWAVVHLCVDVESTATDLSHLPPMAELVTRALEVLLSASLQSPFAASGTEAVVRPFLASRETRQPYTRRDLARLALEYEHRTGHVGDPNPAKTLATEFPGTSAKTWANLFSKARQLGLLSNSPRRGVAGGMVTDAGWEVLVGPDTPTLIGRGRAKSPEDLDDWINEGLNRRARYLRGEDSAEHRAEVAQAMVRARLNGTMPPNLEAMRLQRRARYEAAQERELRDALTKTSSREDLRRLWRDNKEQFAAKPQLKEAWIATAKRLKNDEEFEE